MSKAETVFIEYFGRLAGLPCWQVKRGYASNLTFEFGEPHLRIGQPGRKDREKYLMNRKIIVSGEHHLWVHMCNWQVHCEQIQIAHSESDSAQIDIATKYFDGKFLVEIFVDNARQRADFVFEENVRLSLTAYEDAASDENLWLLYSGERGICQSASGTMHEWQNGRVPEKQIVGRLKRSFKLAKLPKSTTPPSTKTIT